MIDSSLGGQASISESLMALFDAGYEIVAGIAFFVFALALFSIGTLVLIAIIEWAYSIVF